MTQEEIRKREMEIQTTLRKLEEEKNSLHVELRRLREECKHPSVMSGPHGVFDEDNYCSDCRRPIPK